MDSSEKSSSSSSSHSIQGPNPIMTDEDEDKIKVGPSKKIKLSISPGDSLKRDQGSDEDEDPTETGRRVSAVVLPSPSSSRSPEDFVFSIDHILESIFLKCDRQTLLSCRLVSRRWAVYGSKELQKTVIIKFTKVNHFGRRISRTARYISDSGDTGSMKELIALMTLSTEFPSNSFDFGSAEPQGKSKSSNLEIAQAFFNVHGASVKKIIFRHDLSLEDLKHLLLKQAPNLRQLCLDRIKVEYKNSSETKTEEQQLLQQERTRRQELLLFDDTTLISKPILKNLKLFQCHLFSVLPDIFIQQILEFSPNLVEVALPMDQLRFLAQPTIRLPLLKKLMMDITSLSVDTFQLLASLARENENLWAVRELHFGAAENDGEADEDEAFYARATNIMRNILKASSATCQKLVWGAEIENMEMPQMQQLKHLTLWYYRDRETHSVVNSLRGGVSLGDKFPNLKSLEVRSWVEMEDRPIAKIFSDEDQDPSPAANIKTVTLKIRRLPGEILLQSFRDMFPNAHIRVDTSSFRSFYDEGYEVEVEDGGSSGD